jgi:hypothetical protein
MRKLLLLAVAGLFCSSAAYADFTGKDASAATITFKNPGACTSVVCVPIFSLFDPTGTNGAAVPTVGADAQSNTANGLLTYSRNVLWNGATWDRWTGDLTNGGWVNVKTSVLPTGASTSANQTSQITQETATAAALGTTADAPCTLPATTTACSLVATAKATANAANSAIPAGSAIIGKVGIDQTTPGTTNAVSVQYGSTASVADPCQTATKVYTPVNVVTATNIIITGVAAKKKYVCGMFLYPGGTDNIAIYQATTATSCVTAPVGVIGGATTGTGIIATAQAGFVLGNGASAVAATTVVNTDLCITTSAAVQLSGVVVTVDQ